MRASARHLLPFVFALLFSACGPAVDLTKGLQLQVVATGWMDAGIVDGKNKLVPAVSFTLKNVSDRALAALQINGVFRRTGEKEEWGSGLLSAAGSEGLAGCHHPYVDDQIDARLYGDRVARPDAPEHRVCRGQCK